MVANQTVSKDSQVSKSNDNGNTTASSPWRLFLAALFGALVAAVLLLMSESRISTNFALDGGNQIDPHAELRYGYKMLRASLDAESLMNVIVGVRKATLHAPSRGLEELMKKVSETGSRRKAEMKDLSRLEPQLNNGKPPKMKLMDAVNNLATNIGVKDLLLPHRSSTFDVRFVALQYQGTALLSSIASAVSLLETNKERRVWLKAVAKEFDELRTELVNSLENCKVQ